MKTNTISALSRLLAGIGAAALVVSLFVPLWRIELDAPQYPEGLALQIFPHKLGGDVEIINGLNHYIGMQTLHAENFIEFTVLPYIISFFALLFASVALLGKRKWLNTVFFTFVVFGVVAMADFWRWEYNYGHELDPNAAIKVPGMAYQPPLIGFKQLLNFGAYSIPDTGGWLFLLAGALLLAAVLKEGGFFKRFSKKRTVPAAVSALLIVVLSGCGPKGPEPIAYNSDKCDHCRMSIADPRFAAEMMTVKGRVYKFDDLSCLISYMGEHPEPAAKSTWVATYGGDHALIATDHAVFVKAEKFNSPMRGNLAACADGTEAQALAAEKEGTVVNWNELVKEP